MRHNHACNQAHQHRDGHHVRPEFMLLEHGLFSLPYVLYLLCRAGHFPISAEVIEEHEAAVKIDSFQDVVCHQHAQQRCCRLILLECIIAVPNEGIAPQQVRILFPLIQDLIPFHR